MYISSGILYSVLGFCLGYMVRGVVSFVAKKRQAKLLEVEMDKIRGDAIRQGIFEARKLHPEKKIDPTSLVKNS